VRRAEHRDGADEAQHPHVGAQLEREQRSRGKSKRSTQRTPFVGWARPTRKGGCALDHARVRTAHPAVRGRGPRDRGSLV
jgi:hypothetical protein